MPKRKFSTQTWLVTPDKHFAHSVNGIKPMDRHDPSALSVVLQLAKDIKPDCYVDLGDTFHGSYLSHFQEAKDMRGKSWAENGKVIEMNLKDDNLLINVWWDKIQEACGKITEYFALEGNHEEILRNSANMNRYSDLDKTQFYPEESWKLKQRKVKWVPYQRYGGVPNWVSVGPHLKLIHGNFASANHLFKHWTHYQGNLIYGHMHTRETKDFPHPEASTTVQTIGCLCTKEASYHRGRTNAWSQGVSVVHLFPDGTFLDEFIRILNGRAYYNGKTYTAKAERWMD